MVYCGAKAALICLDRAIPRAGGQFALLPSARVVSFGHPPNTSKEEDVTKSEFVDQVSANSGLSKKDAGDAVDAVLQTIEDALKRGSEVTFSGFGKFHVADRSAREGRNPSTGEKIQIAASRVPRFTPGSGLKRSVKG
jgi:DNA-binding protein HU-beta